MNQWTFVTRKTEGKIEQTTISSETLEEAENSSRSRSRRGQSSG